MGLVGLFLHLAERFGGQRGMYKGNRCLQARKRGLKVGRELFERTNDFCKRHVAVDIEGSIGRHVVAAGKAQGIFRGVAAEAFGAAQDVATQGLRGVHHGLELVENEF